MVAVHNHHAYHRHAWSEAWSRHVHPNWPRIALLAGVMGFWAIAAALAARLL